MLSHRGLTCNDFDLGNSVRISKDDTNLGRGCAFLCQFADLVDNLLRSGFQPCGRRAGVRDGA